MTTEQLKEKCEKARTKVVKTRNTLTRHRSILENKIKALEKLGYSPDFDASKLNTRNDIENKAFWLLYDIESKMDDIKNSEKKLTEALASEEKANNDYKAALKMDKYISTAVPKVILDFIENWRVSAIQWQTDVCGKYILEKAEFMKRRLHLMYTIAQENPECLIRKPELKYDGSVSDYRTLMHLIDYRKLSDTFSNHKLTDKEVREYLLHKYGQDTVRYVTAYTDPSERHQKIVSDYTKEAEIKVKELVNNITGYVGRITDASNLHIGNTGGIEGIICGELADVRLETVGAGGYNIQCFHFRTLINKA